MPSFISPNRWYVPKLPTVKLVAVSGLELSPTVALLLLKLMFSLMNCTRPSPNRKCAPPTCGLLKPSAQELFPVLGAMRPACERRPPARAWANRIDPLLKAESGKNGNRDDRGSPPDFQKLGTFLGADPRPAGPIFGDFRGFSSQKPQK